MLCTFLTIKTLLASLSKVDGTILFFWKGVRASYSLASFSFLFIYFHNFQSILAFLKVYEKEILLYLPSCNSACSTTDLLGGGWKCYI